MFQQLVGMHLKEDNRWVRKAQTIPWPEIEKRYAALCTNRKGNVTKPLRLALGACIIQVEYMYDNRTHSVPDRIVSVSQPFVRPIVRGKAGKPVEFGAKLDVSLVNGWARLECCSFDAYHEAGNLKDIVERFREREGHYPRRILADRIYRNRDNLNCCKEHGIRRFGPALGRPKKDAGRDKRQDYLDECERTAVERGFSLAKRKCGLGLVTARLRETSAHVIAMSILTLNLRRIQHGLPRLLLDFFFSLCLNRNLVFAQ